MSSALLSHNQFVSKYSGKKVDFDGYYGGQCVDLFRQYCQEVLGVPQPKGVRGAAQFWENFSSDPVLQQNFIQIPNTLTFVPQKGDVMIWTRKAGNGYGHVAMVDSANVLWFTSFDQNWRKLNVSELTRHNYLAPAVYGVLRKK